MNRIPPEIAIGILVVATLALTTTTSTHASEPPVPAESGLDEPAAGLSDGLTVLQGRWRVAGVYLPTLSDEGSFPAELGFTDRGAEILIRGNAVVCDGKDVAHLATDLALPEQQQAIGFATWKLVLVTLPSGRGLLCSHHLAGDQLEIAFSYKCSCHRGSGHILRFDRIAQ